MMTPEYSIVSEDFLLNTLNNHIRYVDVIKELDLEDYEKISLMEAMKAKGCKFSDNTFSVATIYGDLSIMKWLRDNKCPWGENVFSFAVGTGIMENMKWLHENGCPWGSCIYLSLIHI